MEHNRSLRDQENTGQDIDLKRLQYVFYASSLFSGLVLMSFAFRHINDDNFVLKPPYLQPVSVYFWHFCSYTSKKISMQALSQLAFYCPYSSSL
ncbi:MAG: hypothetical protein ACI89D_001772 [Bermanella sp.]|jgi:hypothetical protein